MEKKGVTFITTQCVEILPSYILKFIVVCKNYI